MIRLFAAVALLVCSCSALAYELATHARLTYAAFSKSTLADSDTIRALGLVPGSTNPFGTTYYDFSASSLIPRQDDPFEAAYMVDQSNPPEIPPGTSPLSLAGWLLRGAIREDDYIGSDAPNPKDDPYNTGAWADNRPLNHFYDPIHNRPLTVLGVTAGETALNWASGSVDAFNQPNTPQSPRRNHFTVLDAREAMYRALGDVVRMRRDPILAWYDVRNLDVRKGAPA